MKLVIFHSQNGSYHCDDGLAAAWVFKRHFGDDVVLHPGVYGREPPWDEIRQAEHVYLVDFSYKREVMQAVVRRSSKVTIIDHHKTAAAELEGFNEELIADGHLMGAGEAEIVFDMNHSGCVLAWRYLHGDDPVPQRLLYVEDGDLFRYALPHSREVQAELRSHRQSPELFDDTMDDPARLKAVIHAGGAVMRYIDRLAELCASNMREVEHAGQKMHAASGVSMIATAGAQAIAERSIHRCGALYWDLADGSRVWSLRSTEDGPDVSDVARKMGGGGHAHAAGFQEKAP